MSRIVTSFSGNPKTTTKYTSTNTAAALTKVDGCIGALITLETNDIRFGFDITPTGSGGANLGHILSAGDSIKLMSGREVGDFRFVSKTAGSHGVLHVTQYTEKSD
ncbi:MAG: hypothetical protein KAS32_10970 [Candidatus Peribacteraceae bacterium]|nr:hypothetical protein [Candidatus Peribacteraceae bacterium]